MTNVWTHTSTDYRYWTSGLFVSLAAFCSSLSGAYTSGDYGISAALSLLFFWGLMRSEEETSE